MVSLSSLRITQNFLHRGYRLLKMTAKLQINQIIDQDDFLKAATIMEKMGQTNKNLQN